MYNKEDKEMYRCFVTMLTHDSGGASAEGEGESLFEELKRNVADEVQAPLFVSDLCTTKKIKKCIGALLPC